MAEKDRETAIEQLEIARTTREAELAQERDIANKTAETRAETAQAEPRAQVRQETADRARAGGEAARGQSPQERGIRADRDRSRHRPAQRGSRARAPAHAEDNAIKIAERSQKVSEARTAAKAAEALAVAAVERVLTAKEKEVDERELEVTVIAAKKEAEREATGVTVTATAERQAAEDRAAAITPLTEAEAIAARSKAEAIAKLGEAEAIAARSKAEAIAKLGEAEAAREKVMNDARRARSAEARAYETGLKRLETILNALREGMRAVEKIDSIRTFDAGGMMGASGNGAGSASLGDSQSGHLLRYQYNSPILGALLSEAGFGSGANPVNALFDGVWMGAPPDTHPSRWRTQPPIGSKRPRVGPS